MNVLIITIFALLLGLVPTPGWSIETAPRISDREIIERLTRLEEGQKALLQRFDALDKRIDGLDKRIDSLEKRIDGLDKRIDEVNRSLGQRIDSLSQRIEEVNRSLGQIMLWGFGVLFSGMLALVGFILWDRRSALAPAVRQMESLKEREERLEAALREYARNTPELAEALRKLGLF
ncbi:MAG: hypothetical protein HYZ50_05295 [Deltaproteobacteria bacterium]|nr:hypothetical protein [Deltaproteobacteria bacterium]